MTDSVTGSAALTPAPCPPCARGQHLPDCACPCHRQPSSAAREWCPNSGTEDGYAHDDRWDEVVCSECGRALYLTKHLRLPRHLTERSLWRFSA